MVHLTCPSSFRVPHAGVCSEGLDQMLSSPRVQFASARWKQTPACVTQLWYFYSPHRLQAAIIISNLMKLMQHLASSCLFASEQTEGHLVRMKQTGSSWERCLHYHLHMKAQSCFSPPHQLSLHDDTGPDIGICVNTTAITSSSLQYPVSHTTMLWTLSATPDVWFYKFAISDPQKRLVRAHCNPGETPSLLLMLFVSRRRQAAEIWDLHSVDLQARKVRKVPVNPIQSKPLETDCPLSTVQSFCCSL